MNDYLIILLPYIIIYLAFIILEFGVPSSLSESFYLLESRYKGMLKWTFTFWLWGLAFTYMWGMNNIWFFVAGMGLFYTGGAAAFKSDRVTNSVHYIGATVGIILPLAYFTVVHHFFWLPLVWVLGSLVCILSEKSSIFWVEIWSLFWIYTLSVYVHYFLVSVV